MVINKYFKDTLELHRIDQVNLGGGSFKDSSPVKVKDVKGKLRPLSGSERYIDQRSQLEVNHKFYCSYDSAIVETNHLFIDPKNNSTFNIVFVKNPMQMNRQLEIDLILVK